MEKKEQIVSLKSELSALVESKKKLTRERVEYKRRTPLGDGARFPTLTRFWRGCRDLKGGIRYTSLLIAFLRGRRYWTVERHATNEVDATYLSNLSNGWLSVEQAKAWLTEIPSTEERSAFEAHLRAAKERARAAKSARAAAIVHARAAE